MKTLSTYQNDREYSDEYTDVRATNFSLGTSEGKVWVNNTGHRLQKIEEKVDQILELLQ